MTEKPARITAKVHITRADGRVLALHRSVDRKHRPLSWDLPGGKAEYREDPNAALVRETEEETGIRLKDAVVHSITSDNSDEYHIYLLYTAQVDTAEIKLSEEHDDYSWVTTDEFQLLDIPSRYKDALLRNPRRLQIQ
jgi:8-oxo-dGTP diphosphatase